MSGLFAVLGCLAVFGGGSVLTTVTVLLILLVQHLGLAPFMAVTGSDEGDGSDGEQAGGEGLHECGRGGVAERGY